MTTTPLLFPFPRRLEFGDGDGAPAATAVQRTRAYSIPSQGFEITVADGAIELRSADDAGERYGLQTIAQLIEHYGSELPRLTVADHPDFPARGLMLDVSRDRVPTRETLARYVDLLELCRMNQFQLYLEHTFAYTGHDDVWGESSPITADDIRWLDALCTERGIELVPNQNTFGHMNHWISTDSHRHRAELVEGWHMGHEHVPSAVLAPTEDNADFVLGLLDELLPLFTSRSVNIGADETFELGKGASAAEVEERGLGAVYVDYVSRIMRPLVERGYTVQYWADIVAAYPELLAEIPAPSIPVVWMYEGPTSLRRAAAGDVDDLGADIDMSIEEQAEGFAARASTFIDAGRPFWVAPGTSTWRSLLGRIDNARENMLDAARVGSRHGSGGFLNTVWGDHGMVEPPSVSFAPVLIGGAVAWNADGHAEVDVAPVLSRWVFDEPAGLIAEALDVLGHLWSKLGVPSVNSSPLFDALMPQLHVIEDLTAVDQALVVEAIEAIQAQIDSLRQARPKSVDGDLVRDELVHVAKLALFAARELLTDPGSPEDRLGTLDRLIVGQRRFWLARSRPGGLDDSLAHFEPLRAALEAAVEHSHELAPDRAN